MRSIVITTIILLGALTAEGAEMSREDARSWAGKFLAGEASALEKLRAGGHPVVEHVRDLFGDAHAGDLQRLVAGICDDELQRSLREESGLQFRGQFAHLEGLGLEGAKAMLAVLEDEDRFARERTRAGLALGDIAVTDEIREAVLPALKEITRDFLSESWLEREAGYLMARLGDRSHVDALIAELLQVVAERPTNANLGALLSAHQELSEVYYRISDYESAVRHYRAREVILVDLRERVREEVLPSIDAEVALLRYNLACSLSLAGRPEEARELLAVALQHDDITVDMVEIDGDLRAVRALEGHEAWLAPFRPEPAEAAPADIPDE